VLQCVAVCCSVLQCVSSPSDCAGDVLRGRGSRATGVLKSVAACCSVCVDVCCRDSRGTGVLQCVAVCCSVLQCVVECRRFVQRFEGY